MRTLVAVAAVLRRFRAERGIAGLLFILVVTTSLVVAAGPRLFDRVADEGLRYAVANATSTQRNLQFNAIDRVRADPSDPLAFVDERGRDLLSRLPATVAGLVTTHGFTVDTPRFRLTDPPLHPSLVTLRYQSGIDAQIVYEAGRAPARATGPSDPAGRPRVEIALSTAAAADLGVDVGDRVPAAIDPSDGILRTVFPRPTTAVMFEVVGLFRVVDPSAAYWFDDPAYARATIRGDDDFPIVAATALFGPGAYGGLLELGAPARYRWRYEVDPDRLDAGLLPALVRDLRQVEAAFGSIDAGAAGRPQYRTGLLDVIDRYRTQRATTETALGVAAIGPLAVATGAVGLVAIIVVRRRRVALLLARGRGASATQLLAAQLWEGLLISIPAALAGLAMAGILVPGRGDPRSSVGVLLVAFAVTALLLASTWPLARRARRVLEREGAAGPPVGPRRLVFEVTFVASALAATWLLRERGLGADRAGGDPVAFDPFLAAAPVLVGLAAGLLTMRLYPLPVRALAALLARRADLVPVLGLRRIGRDPGAALLPLLVLSTTVAIGVFSSLIAVTIERGQIEASWQEIGADYRVDAAPGARLAADLDPGGGPGVSAVAAALVTSTSSIAADTGQRGSTTVVAIEPAAYDAVLAGSPVATSLGPLADPGAVGPDSGTPERPIPVLLSERPPNDWLPLAVGDVFRLGISGRPLTLQVVGFRASLPGLRPDATFVVAPLDAIRAAIGGSDPRPTTLFIRADPDAAAALRSALDVSSAPALTSRRELLAAQRAAPLVAAVGQGFGVAFGAAALYAILAVVASIVIDAGQRARELAHLRTLGLTDRQALGLIVVEHVPPAVIALAVGIGLGFAVAWLLEPGLGLAAYIGPTVAIRLQVEWSSVIATAAAVALVVAIMVGVSAWFSKRLGLGAAMRMGDR
jgi:putative ABC transport system permease protein